MACEFCFDANLDVLSKIVFAGFQEFFGSAAWLADLQTRCAGDYTEISGSACDSQITLTSGCQIITCATVHSINLYRITFPAGFEDLVQPHVVTIGNSGLNSEALKITETNIKYLYFPELQTVEQGLHVNKNNDLVTIDFPKLVILRDSTVIRGFNIEGNRGEKIRYNNVEPAIHF